MTVVNREELQAAVLEAQAALDKLLEIEALLEPQLLAARSVLQDAEKALRNATKPTRAAVRKHELDLLKKRLEEAKENA